MLYVDFIFNYYPKSSGYSNRASEVLLAFKKSDKYAVKVSEEHLQEWIDDEIDRPHMLCAVPSCRMDFVNQITKSAKSLAAKNPWLTDGTHCIIKRKSTKSFCMSNNRKASTLIQSLEILPDVAHKHILLLDDITTSGTTMRTLSSMLLSAGALSVTCLALGKTMKKKGE